jgi:hypothetical protein
MIRHVIDNYDKTTPAILEIPSKEHAYDPSKDYILKRAQVDLPYPNSLIMIFVFGQIVLIVFIENVFS